jgi:hypothetical protein
VSVFAKQLFLLFVVSGDSVFCTQNFGYMSCTRPYTAGAKLKLCRRQDVVYKLT